MKNLKIKLLSGVVLLIITSIVCSKHCDDEDYTTKLSHQNSIRSDTFNVTIENPNKT